MALSNVKKRGEQGATKKKYSENTYRLDTMDHRVKKLINGI
jgi:hypothetical protein